MNRRLAKLLQVFVVGTGIGALAFLLIEPHFEGRNARATLTRIYFDDPFLAYVYIASIPFFVAAYQAFKALGDAAGARSLAPETLKRIRTVKHCGIALVGLVAVGEVFILSGDSDDRAGGVFMGILFGAGAVAIAVAATMFERVCQNRPASQQ